MPKFVDHWETARIGDLLDYERPDNYIVKSVEYSDKGNVPVLTANKAFVLGFTDETFGVYSDVPAIIFDDFTTDCKFVVNPFKVKSSAIKILKPKHDRVSLRYVFERMRLVRFAPGIHKRHYIAEYQNIRLSVPNYDEQIAIASALSDVDELLGSLDALIAKKRDVKHGAMDELLTGKNRLPGFRGKWEKRRLGQLGWFTKGRGIKRDDVSSFGVPCIRYGELYTRYTDNIVHPIDRIPLEVAAGALAISKGVLLFAGSGETASDIGRCAAYLGDEQAYAGGDIIAFSPAGQDSRYLGYLMNYSTVAAQKARMAQGDAVVHISAANLSQVQIALPPLEEQTAIAVALIDMDTEILALEQRRDKTCAVQQGMMQELLTGRTRLCPPTHAVSSVES